MNIEDQTSSLELSKRLKELGVKQESLFFWIKNMYGELITHNLKRYFTQCGCPTLFESVIKNIDGNEIYSALTVAELGEMLPKYISTITEDENKKEFCNFRFVTGRSLIIEENNPIEVWSVNYICDTTNEFRNWLFDPLLTKAIYDKSEANARAKMLIHLIENGLITHETR